MRSLLIAALMIAWAAPALAVDAVTAASRKIQYAGTDNAVLWIVGRGFDQGVQVAISGDGITIDAADRVPEDQRIDGGQGDGIALYFRVAQDATRGLRNITVTNPDGASATGEGLVQIVAGNGEDGRPPAPETTPVPVDRVTRASPSYAEQGAQVNLWIVGGPFQQGATVSFDAPGLGPARVGDRELPTEVLRNAESEGGENDGIQYFLQVSPEAPVGYAAITVQNPDGSQATGRELFEIVPRGAVPVGQPGDGDVDGITGASPPGAFVGRSVALWIWGEGFKQGATVSFSNPGITAYAASEVVEVSRSHPGFSGIRNFLTIAPEAAAGPVTVTVRNPNGTQVVAEALFELVDGTGNPGERGAVTDLGNCPDVETSISDITRVVPNELARGSTVTVAIQGQAFACGAGILIPGGGLKPVGQPRLVRDTGNPFFTTLFWQFEVAFDATVGPRAVTVINPNNSSKTLPDGLVITDPPPAKKDDDLNCSTTPGPGSGGFGWILLGLLACVRRR